MKTLREAKIGETVKVVKLHGEGAIKRRIMDMGITKGTEVYVRKVAPLGDPVEVTVRCRDDRDPGIIIRKQNLLHKVGSPISRGEYRKGASEWKSKSRLP